MKKLLAMILTLAMALSLLGGAQAESILGDLLDLISSGLSQNEPGFLLRPEPSALLTQTVAGKTFSAKYTGCVWGGDEESAILSFTLTEPALFSADAVEKLQKGDMLWTDLDIYSVKALHAEDGVVTVTPSFSWQSPVTLRKTEDGAGYILETDEGLLMQDVFSINANVNPNFTYTDESGAALTLDAWMELYWANRFDLSEVTVEITFDQEGQLLAMTGPAPLEETDWGGDSWGDDDPLSLWTADSLAKEMLISYVEDVTDFFSDDYIPYEDRIAVFDLDGTLFCETDPNYFDYMLLVHRVLEDPDYKDLASDFERETALKIVEQNETGASFSGLEVDHGKCIASAFAGMTIEEFNVYIQAFKQLPMPSYVGMNRGDGWYLPMLQVVEYLQSYDFTVYVVSGTDRFIVRGIAYDSPLNIPPRQIIGSDETVVASGQNGENGLNYVFVEGDTLILGGDFVVKNLKMNKVSVIIQEIGQQPVLSFGNSTGDASMAEYVTSNNPYASMAFMLCCDDTVRENGDESKASKMFTLCETFGWVPVSMRDDWTTIYGDDVTRINVSAPAETEPAAFVYENDPRENPRAMADIVENPAAVYGFSPNPESARLGAFADAIDWTDQTQVAEARAERLAYHESMSELYRMIEDMLHQGKNVEEIARAVSQRRNELRLEAYADDPDGLALIKQSNLETYGDEMGPSADSLHEKYGSWQTVLEKALSTNMGMDACLGLYDEFFYTYVDMEIEP